MFKDSRFNLFPIDNLKSAWITIKRNDIDVGIKIQLAQVFSFKLFPGMKNYDLFSTFSISYGAFCICFSCLHVLVLL